MAIAEQHVHAAWVAAAGGSVLLIKAVGGILDARQAGQRVQALPLYITSPTLEFGVFRWVYDDEPIKT